MQNDSVRNIKHSIQMHNGPCIFIEQIIEFEIITAPFIDSPMFNVKYLTKHKVQIRVELRVRLARRETGLSPPVKYFN